MAAGQVRAARRGFNTAERRSILAAWWLYYRTDLEAYADMTLPGVFVEALEEIEASPEACDEELVDEFPGTYTSQLPL